MRDFPPPMADQEDNTGWITAPAPDRVEVLLEGRRVATLRSAKSFAIHFPDAPESFYLEVDELGQYVVIKVDSS